MFKELMSTEKNYQNLICYTSVCCLLVDERTAKPYYEVNKEVMKKFVDDCQELYGQAFLVYNVYSQLHFPDVAKVYGSIDNVSAYGFENKLGEFKKIVRSIHRPIVSLIKGIQRKQASEGKFMQSLIPVYTKAPNNVYIDIINDDCSQVTDVTDKEVKCTEFLNTGPFYRKPIDSRVTGCFRVRVDSCRFLSVTIDYIRQCRRGIRVDLWKLEGLNSLANKNVSIFMSMLHDQDYSCW